MLLIDLDTTLPADADALALSQTRQQLFLNATRHIDPAVRVTTEHADTGERTIRAQIVALEHHDVPVLEDIAHRLNARDARTLSDEERDLLRLLSGAVCTQLQ